MGFEDKTAAGGAGLETQNYRVAVCSYQTYRHYSGLGLRQLLVSATPPPFYRQLRQREMPTQATQMLSNCAYVAYVVYALQMCGHTH